LADHTYTRHEVISLGFEARCVGVDGARYIWHRNVGMRVEPPTGRTTLLSDPAKLPGGVWFPTPLGLEELATACEFCPDQEP